MRRLLAFLSCLVVVLSSPLGRARLGGSGIGDIGDAITELDVERARALLASIDSDSAALALERARLALYVDDCDAASATLATLNGVKDAGPLAELAKNCARATAGALVIEDKERGLFIRLQDDADRALVPLLSETAVRARAAIERDLGVVMPRPLRIELVRDLFSRSALSGLPLSAAETTGTVAVARWGRVNMISPRAAFGGFPWEDTLAHEITHLALTRATRDGAPLWLQEGIAKRQETRWRAPRAFDGEPSADAVARDALLTGQSVGVDKIGPSIAMLPSADAASIAFAEVSSFVEYWIQQNGKEALRLLFADIKGLGGNADSAMKSVSGYDLHSWILRWQHHLVTLPAHAPEPSRAEPSEVSALEALQERSMKVDAKHRARDVRTSELLFARGAPVLAAEHLRRAFTSDPNDAGIRFRLGQSLIAFGQGAAAAPLFLEAEHDLDGLHAGWLALSGRYRRERGEPAAQEAFDFALSLDPYMEVAACEGWFRVPDAAGHFGNAETPSDPARRALCESARKIQSN
jgi:tetratricopeptide (TPR) repeat protein